MKVPGKYQESTRKVSGKYPESTRKGRDSCLSLRGEPFPPSGNGGRRAAFIREESLSYLQEKGRVGLPLSGRRAFPTCRSLPNMGESS